MAAIYPSLMNANLLNLELDIAALNPHVPGYHIDIMDNHFVPNMAFDFDTIHAIARITKKQLWIHAMVDNPTAIIDQLQLPENTIYSFHIESKFEKKEVFKKLTEKNWLPSIAIKPKTNVAQLLQILDHNIYQVLVMSVEPGFAGQQFIPDSIAKLDELTAFRAKHNLDFMIGIDGGINCSNIANVVQYGADQIAAASAIFNNPDRVAAYSALKKCIKE
jgi:ribulose-phosphate 3-epimerase